MAKKKNDTVGVTAVKDFLKREKAKEIERNIRLNGSKERELTIRIKTEVPFSEICRIGLDACDRAEEAKLTLNDGSPLQKVGIDDYMLWYTIIANFTNIKIDGLDVDAIWELINFTDIKPVLRATINNKVLEDLIAFFEDTMRKHAEEDTWKGLGTKLSGLLDKVGQSVDETLLPEVNQVIKNLGRIANLHDEQVIEAVFDNGTNGKGHNAASEGVQQNS